MMTKENLKKLKKRLPFKWGTLLSNKTGFAKVTVLKVLNAGYENDIILDAAIALAEENEKKIQSRKL